MAPQGVLTTADNRVNNRPGFLITIDTEGDNLWARPRCITTENARFLPRFQSFCEGYGLKPTYLTNWEMATCPRFNEFARDVIARDKGEIGMHLHAWNSPPIIPLTADDFHHHPYLMEYPESVIREKVAVMTRTLENIFAVKIISHRAGRSGFDKVYARALVDCDYRVDCSVMPHVSWRSHIGDPNRQGGTDYTHFPESPYFLDLNDISRPGDSPLLEVPVTCLHPRYPRLANVGLAIAERSGRLGYRFARHFYPTYVRLIPNGRNRRLLLALIQSAQLDGRDYIELMFHSSELMPACSPNFPTERSIENLYHDLDALFQAAHPHFKGQTLAEYHDLFVATHAATPSRGGPAGSNPLCARA